MTEALRLDVVAGNLANAATVGYKRDTVSTETFADLYVSRLDDAYRNELDRAAAGAGAPPAAVGSVALGAVVGRTATRLSDGSLRQTGRALDVALQGDGFFAVQTERGPRFTRDGSFQRDAQGRLTTAAGHLVLVGGRPVGEAAATLTILASGEVLVDGASTGQLDVVTSAQAGPLRKEGANLWAPAAGAGQLVAPAAPLVGNGRPYRLQTGFLEEANAQPVLEMVELITAMRSYEASQKAIQTQDETLSKAVNDIGRL